jgi:hypothetical protein
MSKIEEFFLVCRTKQQITWLMSFQIEKKR